MTLKEQIIDVIEKHPEFVEWLEQEYDFSFCPPGGSCLSNDQLDEFCYGGCKLCWENYKNSNVESIEELIENA